MKARDWLIRAGTILVLMAGLSLPASLVQAQGVTVTADAPAEAGVDSDFIVRLDITTVTDFDAASLRVRFDPAIIRLDSITAGDIGGTTIPLAASAEIEPGLWGMLANVPGFPGVDGSGYLLEVHFRALAVGTSTIGLEQYSMSDYLAQEISATWVGDSVDVVTGATVDVSVVLQGGSRPDAGWAVPITIKFFTPGADVLNDSPVAQFDLTPTKPGSTAISSATPVASGTYDITAVSEHTLVNVRRDVAVSTPSTAVDMGTLLEGNVNNDSLVNISDFSGLAGSFMKSDGQAGYNAMADFDRNAIVNIADFGLLATNFMVS